MRGLFGLDVILADDGCVFLGGISVCNQGAAGVLVVDERLWGLSVFAVVLLSTLLGGRVVWLPGSQGFNSAMVRAATGPVPGPCYL
ncbi:hypothetical protein ACFZB9_24320 [Kitasatospora sp. NPDC008050]|uniref:hypothetical protein n=1 Tax=Kitasatospora sp. NPDC008050 TaxID=3364021 RepID=UPI0036EC7E2A